MSTKKRTTTDQKSPKRGSYMFGLFENAVESGESGENITVKFHENYYYKRGMFYHFKEDDKKAREYFTKAYETDSKCIEALVGRSYLELLAYQENIQILDSIEKSFQYATAYCHQYNRNEYRIFSQFGSILILLLKFKIRDIILETDNLLTQIEQRDLLHIVPHEILNEISKLLRYIQSFIFQGNKYYLQDLKNSTSLLSISTYRILSRFQLPPTLPEQDLRNWLVDMIMNNNSLNLFLKNSVIRQNQQIKYAEMNFCDLIFKFLTFNESKIWWSSIVKWAIKNERLSLTTLLLMDNVAKIEENLWIITDIIEIAFKSTTQSGNWISILRTLKPIFKDKVLIKSSDLLRAITMNHYDLTNSIINLYPELINSKVDEFYTITPYSKALSNRCKKNEYNNSNPYNSGYSSSNPYYSGSDLSELDDFEIIDKSDEIYQKKYQKTILMYAIENTSCSMEILVLLTVQWLINMKFPDIKSNNNNTNNNANNNTNNTNNNNNNNNTNNNTNNNNNNTNNNGNNKNNNNGAQQRAQIQRNNSAPSHSAQAIQPKNNPSKNNNNNNNHPKNNNPNNNNNNNNPNNNNNNNPNSHSNNNNQEPGGMRNTLNGPFIANNQQNESNSKDEENEKGELSSIIQFLDYLVYLDDDLTTMHRIATFVSILRRNHHWFVGSNIDYHRKICKLFIKECSNWQKKINLKLISDFYDDFSMKDIISSSLIIELIDRFIGIDYHFDSNQWYQAEMVIAWIINFVSSNLSLFTCHQFQHLLFYFREAYKFISYVFEKKGEFQGGDLSHYRKYEYIKGIEFQLALFFERVCIEQINQKIVFRDHDRDAENAIDWRSIMDTFVLLKNSTQSAINQKAENLMSNIQMKLQQLSSNVRGPLRLDANFNKVVHFGLYAQSLETTLDNKIVITNQLHSPYVEVEEYCNSVLKEAKLLQAIHHNNIANCIGYNVDKDKGPLIFIERANDWLDTWLEHLAASQSNLNEKEVVKILIDIAHSLLFLQFNSIIHKDLNLCNFQIAKNFRVQISDFGNWRLIPNQIMPTSYGSPHFISPEIIARIGGDQKSNVWSFGILIGQLIMLKKIEISGSEDLPALIDRLSPEDRGYVNKLMEGISDKKLAASFLAIRLHYIQFVTQKMPALSSLVSLCLEVNPAKRPEFLQILNILNFLYMKYYYENTPNISKFKSTPL